MYEQLLKNAGLLEKEVRVYLAALEFGPMTVQQLAQRTHIGRTTVYVEIASLMKKGFMSKIEKYSKIYFSAETPESLERLFQKQIEVAKQRYSQFKKVLPRLKTIAETAEDKPRVRFFEDKEGIMAIQKDIIRSRAESLDEFIAIDLDNLLFPRHYKDHRSRIAKKYKKIRVIYTTKNGAALTPKEGPRERRLIPAKQFPFQGELVLYDGKVAMVTQGTKKIGVIVEHRSIADMLRSLFELAWQEAGRLNQDQK